MTNTHAHGHHGHAAGHHSPDSHGSVDSHGAAGEGMTDLLELDGEVLHDYWSAALDWVRDAAAESGPRRLLDLGAGTGTGAIGLARRFPAAEVIAVDVEPGSLELLRDKADGLGLGDRVHAVAANLDEGWPDLGVLDVTWASMSLHHLADPGRVLGQVLAATRPGGLIAVAEFADQLRFLPDDLGFGRPGFEDRMASARAAAHAEVMPTLGSEWAPRLADAGWEITGEREFVIDLRPPADSPSRAANAGEYARVWFDRLSRGLADRLDSGDVATLGALLDRDSPQFLLNRGDLWLHGSRTVTLARRP
jgi:SAM-dependent methyltransferase